MSTYAIGDIHGCWKSLSALMLEIAFDPSKDRLWLVGDLVNRGPASLECLRWARGLGDRAVVVLGNHDLHLLAVHHGLRERRKQDTFDDVFAAPDREDLLDWLLTRPLIYEDELGLLVHAGLLPSWTIEEAHRHGTDAAQQLQSHPETVLAAVQGSGPCLQWSMLEDPVSRAAATLKVLAFTRCMTETGQLVDFSGPPTDAPVGAKPWFVRRERGAKTVYFGHWAALGLHESPGYRGLDTGCAWGGRLTAIRIEDGVLFQIQSRDPGTAKRADQNS